MEANLEQRINLFKMELLKLYEGEINFQDPELMNKSMELDQLINQYQKELLMSSRQK